MQVVLDTDGAGQAKLLLQCLSDHLIRYAILGSVPERLGAGNEHRSRTEPEMNRTLPSDEGDKVLQG